ncbi:hypothetical protein GOV07_00945 [Candidatus Woesearchaeota archaeon]|nr:hypothetical protein [Candidatus Woesearchaeota archaeon]
MAGRDHENSNHWATPFFFFLLLALFLTPALVFVYADTDTFTASVTVNNLPPSVVVDTGQSITGQVAGSRVVYVLFNASDPNGGGDLNTTSAQITINKTGNTDRTSSSCALDSIIDVNTRRYNCSVTIWFYDEAGTWTINASIEDNTSNEATNNSVTLTMNVLDGVSVIQASVGFTGTPGTNDIASSPEPQQLNNTGNLGYTQINITAFDFASGANRISVGNVTTNVTDSNGPGQQLVNNTAFTIANAALPRGDNSLEDMYFWLDIPSGTPPGTYNAQSNWILEAT